MKAGEAAAAEGRREAAEESRCGKQQKGRVHRGMKAWKLYGVNDLRFEESVIPAPGAGQALVKVKAAGICGSDVQRVFETGAHRHPLVIGHEFSGVVEDVGQGISREWLHRRVGVFPLIPCGKCASCRQKKYEMCRSYDYLGSRCDGGFAEYVAVPAANLIELPDNVTFEEAAMLEPMAVAVHAMRRAAGGTGYSGEPEISRDAAVAICGFGTIGALLAAFLMDAGYGNLWVVGNKEFQRQTALCLSIPPERFCDSRKQDAKEWLQAGGTDLFFECTGRNEVLAWGVDSARPSGKIILVGNPRTDMGLGKDTYWKILRSQLTLAGIWNSSFTGEETDDWHYTADRLAAGNIDPASLVTHRLPLAGLREGLAVMREKREDYCKIMVFPDKP